MTASKPATRSPDGRQPIRRRGAIVVGDKGVEIGIAFGMVEKATVVGGTVLRDAIGAPAGGERALMNLKLHANATTTPRTRGYIQKSRASNRALAPRTRHPQPHRGALESPPGWARSLNPAPNQLATAITACAEALILDLRRSLALPALIEGVKACPRAGRRPDPWRGKGSI